MNRRQFNKLINRIRTEGNEHIKIHGDMRGAKYIGVEVSKNTRVYHYSVIQINSAYETENAVISKILDIAKDLYNKNALDKD